MIVNGIVALQKLCISIQNLARDFRNVFKHELNK